MTRSAKADASATPMKESVEAQVRMTFLPSSKGSDSRRMPFTRADAFGAILEAATVPGVGTRGEASFAFYEFVSRAQVARTGGEARAAALAAALLDVLDEILALRLMAPIPDEVTLRTGAGAFLLAIDLVFTKDPVELLERTGRTLRVPPELAEKIISVLRETDW